MLYTWPMALMKTQLRQAGVCFAAAGRMMLRHEVPRDAAGISYFSVVALFPAMLVMITVVDVSLGWVNLHETVIQQIIALFPGSRQFLSANLSEITTPSTAVAIACVAVVLWSASWMFTFMESAINRAWGAPIQRTFWQSRMLGIAFMVLIGASLLTSAAITYYVSNVRARAAFHDPASVAADFLIGWFWYSILLGAGLLIAILVFALIFKWTPHHRVFWSEAFAGAAATTILWEIGSFIFMKVVPFFDYQRIYGRMGAAIALLVWVYTSNLIMLFGANFSAQLHLMTLEKPLPYSGSLPGGTV
jgi:membrane protein